MTIWLVKLIKPVSPNNKKNSILIGNVLFEYMKKAVVFLIIFIVILGVAVSIIQFWKKSVPTLTPQRETTKKVSSYFDGTYGYDCSRAIWVKAGTAQGQVVGSTVDIQIPLDSDEAKLFCHSTFVIENKGKITVLQRPEVIELISKYEYKYVSIKALEFKYIKDQQFVDRLLPAYQDREIGCIVVLETPGEKRVYLEDEKLEIFEELDYKIFEQYLNQVSEGDQKIFIDNLR